MGRFDQTFVHRNDGAREVRRVDNRTRRDHVLHRNLAFMEQIPAMTDAYLIWSLEKMKMGFRSFFDRRDEMNEVTDGGQWTMTIIDSFCK
jgi:Cu/Ag efflux protein CusF